MGFLPQFKRTTSFEELLGAVVASLYGLVFFLFVAVLVAAFVDWLIHGTNLPTVP
jgi:hypothetical protein